MSFQSLVFGPPASSRVADLGLLVLRLGVGLTLALGHGLGKLPPSAGFVDATASMGFPFPVLFAWAAALSEFVGGLFLAAGLATRPAAAFVAFTMGIAFFVRHGGDVGEGELALIYLVAAVALALTGPGELSIDRRLHPASGNRP